MNETIKHRDGLIVRCVPRVWSRGMTNRELYAKARLYVPWDLAGPQPEGPPCTDLKCDSGHCAEARRNGHPEHCEVDHKVWRAYIRGAHAEVRRRMRPILAEFMPSWRPDDIKIRYSVHAGCSMCPCSPGYIIDEPALSQLDFWVKHDKSLAPGQILANNIASVAEAQLKLVRV